MKNMTGADSGSWSDESFYPGVVIYLKRLWQNIWQIKQKDKSAKSIKSFLNSFIFYIMKEKWGVLF